MKQKNIDSLFAALLKYIWLICLAMLLLEAGFTVNTAVTATKSSAEEIMSATKRELENKLNVTWMLADAMTKDLTLSDTDISLEERALYLKPYNDTYGLFLIGITDRNGKITSSYDDIPGNIGYRDYFQYSLRTGESVLTDAFPAGADGTTLNYTICAPYYDGGEIPEGVLILSIPFDGVNEIITGAVRESDFMFTLLNSEHSIMAEKEELLIGKPFSDLVQESDYLSMEADQLITSISSGQMGSYWTIDNKRPLYVSYAPVERTPWTLLTSVDVLDACQPSLLLLAVKVLLILLVFGVMHLLGKRFMETKLADTTKLLLQVDKLQTTLREEKLIISDNFEELADISKSGLLDSLTNLPTRLGIRTMMAARLKQVSPEAQAVFILIDLDGLKSLNDSYGHIVGDRAIAAFGEALRAWAQETGGIVGRFGGDEFVAFFAGENHETIVDKVLQALRIDLEAGEGTVPLHASVGAARYPACGTSFEQLYVAADKALYHSKQNGKDCYTFSEDCLVISA